MKRLLVVLMAVGLFGAMPAFAADHADMKKGTSEECAMRCATESETIQGKIERIQKEIKEGSKKYTPEQLKKLEKKLKEANKLLNEMYGP